MKKSCSLLDILRPASGRETLRRTPDGRRRHAGDAKQADPYRQVLEITTDQYQMLMQGLEIVARRPIEEVPDPEISL